MEAVTALHQEIHKILILLFTYYFQRFLTISDYFNFSYSFHYLLTAKSQNSVNSQNSLLQSKKSRKKYT